MEPIEYLRIFRQRWTVVALVCVFGAAAAFVTAPSHRQGSRAVNYQATATLLLGNNAPAGTPSLPQAALLTTSGEVPRRAASQLNFTSDPAVLAAAVTAKADPLVNVLRISSIQSDGARAAQLANTFADQLEAYLNDQAQSAYQKQVSDIQTRLNQLDKQIGDFDAGKNGSLLDPVVAAQRDAVVNQYRLAYDRFQQIAAQGQPDPAFTTLQKAVPVAVADTSFHGPTSRIARTLIGVLAGLVLGVGLVLLLERINVRIRTKEEAEDAFGHPVIAEIPTLARRRRRRKELETVARPGSPFAEAHRILRTLLLLRPGSAGNGSDRAAAVTSATPSRLGADPQVIMVVSPGPAEGKTTTVAHLAVAMAEAGRSVLVLSCDFRRPRIHHLFNVAERAGLTDLLSVEGVELADVVQPTGVRGVNIIHSGSFVANPAELLAAGHGFLDQARHMADIVIIDTAPLLVANDASELMPAADAVIIVSRSGKTTRGAAQRASQLLERVGAKVVGVVLTAAPEAPTDRRYYYYRYYLSQEGPLGWRRLMRRIRHQPQHAAPRRVEPRPRAEVPADAEASAGRGAPTGNGAESRPVRSPDADPITARGELRGGA